MSKRTRNMLLSLLALVAVAAIVVVVVVLPGPDTTGGDETSTTTTTAVPDIVIADKSKNAQGGVVTEPVVRVDIQNQKDTFSIAKRDDNLMAVEAYKDVMPDTTTITVMCQTLSYLTAVSKVSANEADSAYGLDQPLATITATYHDGEALTFHIGAESKGTEGYYCRRDGDKTLYIIEKAVAEMFFDDGMQLVGKMVIAPPAVNEDDEEGRAQLLDLRLTGACREQPIEIITDVDASYPGMTYVSPYVVRQPFLRAVDSDLFVTITANMNYLVASGVAAVRPTAEQLEEFGLNDPHSVAAFTLAVVTTTAADNGGTKTSHYNDRDYMVLLGNKTEDGDYYAVIAGKKSEDKDYALIGGGIVYTVTPDSVPWAELQYIDVTNKLLFMKDIKSVAAVTVIADGASKTFALEHRPDEEERDKQMVVTSDDKTYGTHEFRVLYQLMIGIKRVDNKEEGATAQGDPVMKLEMTFNDSTAPMEITLYPMSANRYLCVTADGEETAVSIKNTDDFLKQYRNYLNGDPVLSTY